MRAIPAFLLLCAAAAVAAPPGAPNAVRDSKTALEIARTRGKLIFLTVIVDHDHENRAVVENVFRDKAFLKMSEEFVVVYANNEDQHGKVMVKNAQGQKEPRCADCPSIVCTDHIGLAQNFARGFFPDSDAKTPIHFVIDGNENVVETIMNGDFKTGFNHVPAKEVCAALKRVLDKHGKGLSEEAYAKMLENLADSKAARARGNLALELEKLVPILALDRDIEGVREARERMKQIDEGAAAELAKVGPLASAGQWEEAIEELRRIAKTYPGTLTAGAAATQQKELLARPEVKKLLLARELYEKGMELLEGGKNEAAKKKLEECLRRGGGTKWAELASEALHKLATGG